MINMQGIIVKAISGFYYVNYNENLYECKARGSFRKAEVSPVVGDKVEFSLIDDVHGVVEKILNRKNLMTRPIVANIDKLFIVSAFKTPAPDTFMIDRLCAVAVYNDIEPIIVFNKCDLGDFSEFKKIYRNTGFKVYTVSAEKGIGINEIADELSKSVSAFAGNSGVGKSSLINAIYPDLNLKTGEVSDKLGRGRHTTRHTELFGDENRGFIADTPGFSFFEVDNTDYDFKLSLDRCFPDFSDYIDSCKFSGCSHTCEKGCSLIEAVNSGYVEKSRHNSYITMFEELKDLKEWNTLPKSKFKG